MSASLAVKSHLELQFDKPSSSQKKPRLMKIGLLTLVVLGGTAGALAGKRAAAMLAGWLAGAPGVGL